ncbi:MAG: hypothetical protein ABSB15_07385 [Bryobacteraceae bacterium]
MAYPTDGATVSIGNDTTRRGVAGASTFGGGATITLNGSLYFPVGAVTINNGTPSATTVVVASTILDH